MDPAQALATYGVTSVKDIEQLLFTDDVQEALAFITKGLEHDLRKDAQAQGTAWLGSSFSMSKAIKGVPAKPKLGRGSGGRRLSGEGGGGGVIQRFMGFSLSSDHSGKSTELFSSSDGNSTEDDSKHSSSGHSRKSTRSAAPTASPTATAVTGAPNGEHAFDHQLSC